MPTPFTLDALLEEACQRFAPGDAPTRYFAQARPHAAEFRRLLLTGTGSTQRLTAYLTPGADRCAPLPDGYAGYTMLGLLRPGWAHARNLVYNGLLAGPTPADYAGPLPGPPDFTVEATGADPQALCYDGADYRGYGHPCWGPEFRIEEAQHRIVCSSRLPADAVLVLEYRSFDAPDGEDIVLEEAARSWGVLYVVERMWADKQNWPAAEYWGKAARREYERYAASHRNFSLQAALQAKHQAAGQRWK